MQVPRLPRVFRQLPMRVLLPVLRYEVRVFRPLLHAAGQAHVPVSSGTTTEAPLKEEDMNQCKHAHWHLQLAQRNGAHISDLPTFAIECVMCHHSWPLRQSKGNNDEDPKDVAFLRIGPETPQRKKG